MKQGAPAQKIMVGMPTYGRSFTLANVTQFDIGAPASGGGSAGRYTQETGFYSYYEVCGTGLCHHKSHMSYKVL